MPAFLIDPLVRRVRSKRVRTPMLILGAEQDGLVTRAEVRATTRAYGTEPEFSPPWGTT